MPCSLALVAHAYHDAGERMRAIGIWAGAGGMAMVAGPVVGGALTALFGWRSIFLVNLPIGVIGLWLTLRFTTETEGRHNRALDLPGQVLAIVALVALTGSIIEGAPLGWTHPAVLGGIALFLAAGAGFLRGRVPQRGADDAARPVPPPGVLGRVADRIPDQCRLLRVDLPAQPLLPGAARPVALRHRPGLRADDRADRR